MDISSDNAVGENLESAGPADQLELAATSEHDFVGEEEGM